MSRLPHPLRLAIAAAAIAPLAACYVVPIDPRTGQGYPVARADAGVPPPVAVALQPTTMSARLYPLNDQANKGGMLVATVVDGHAGRGSFSLAYLGDTLQGEATRVDASYAAFGRVHNEVLGPANRSWSGRRGIANAYGSRGVSLQCEYLITGPSMGTGACQFSDGAKYQMHFGG